MTVFLASVRGTYKGAPTADLVQPSMQQRCGGRKRGREGGREGWVSDCVFGLRVRYT